MSSALIFLFFSKEGKTIEGWQILLQLLREGRFFIVQKKNLANMISSIVKSGMFAMVLQ